MGTPLRLGMGIMNLNMIKMHSFFQLQKKRSLISNKTQVYMQFMVIIFLDPDLEELTFLFQTIVTTTMIVILILDPVMNYHKVLYMAQNKLRLI